MEPSSRSLFAVQGIALSLLLALVAISCIETGAAASAQTLSGTETLWTFSLAMREALLYLWPAAGFGLGSVALLLVPQTDVGGRVRASGAIVICVAFAAAVYRTLTLYGPFEAYPPFIVGAVLGAAGLVGLVLLWSRTRSGRIRPVWMRVLAALLLVAGGVLPQANYHFYRGYYATLHLAVAQVNLLVLFLGFAGALVSLYHTRLVRLGSILMLVLVLGAGATGALADGTAALVPGFVDTAVLGQARVVFTPFVEEKGGRRLFDTAGVERFHKHSGLPKPPEGFVLDDYNVLFIASEATRFDQTSLFDRELKTTPHLLRRSKDALVFTRAYAPSSGTLHSIAAIVAMSYPSMVAMETWMKVWTGELYEEEETVAETLKQAGYDTFRVGYNHWFPKHLLGFDQGLSEVELIPGTDDSAISAKAVEFIERRAESRFFGWVFFVSPHGPYEAHGYGDMPRRRGLDRYRQEIRFVDEQVEKVFSVLEERRILDRTVVVFVGDHGEEFREHGGTKHKTTVYAESIRVPLMVWIPGMAPGRFSDPTSTAYVFPWLFSQARSALLRDRFAARAKTVFGPMLRETDGAVVVELVGHNRMRSSLVWADLKVNYDFISGRIEVYRPVPDRLEKHDLFGADAALDERATSMLDAYKSVRSAGARYVLKPKKRAAK